MRTWTYVEGVKMQNLRSRRRFVTFSILRLARGFSCYSWMSQRLRLRSHQVSTTDCCRYQLILSSLLQERESILHYMQWSTMKIKMTLHVWLHCIVPPNQNNWCTCLAAASNLTIECQPRHICLQSTLFSCGRGNNGLSVPPPGDRRKAVWSRLFTGQQDLVADGGDAATRIGRDHPADVTD